MAYWRTTNSFLSVIVWDEESIVKDAGIEVVKGEEKVNCEKWFLSEVFQLLEETQLT